MSSVFEIIAVLKQFRKLFINFYSLIERQWDVFLEMTEEKKDFRWKYLQ